jgi:hypothetical protein
VILECEQCGCASRGRARGWAAFVAEDDEHGEPPCVGIFCPRCAAVEFDHRPEAADEYT